MRVVHGRPRVLAPGADGLVGRLPVGAQVPQQALGLLATNRDADRVPHAVGADPAGTVTVGACDEPVHDARVNAVVVSSPAPGAEVQAHEAAGCGCEHVVEPVPEVAAWDRVVFEEHQPVGIGVDQGGECVLMVPAFAAGLVVQTEVVSLHAVTQGVGIVQAGRVRDDRYSGRHRPRQ